MSGGSGVGDLPPISEPQPLVVTADYPPGAQQDSTVTPNTTPSSPSDSGLAMEDSPVVPNARVDADEGPMKSIAVTSATGAPSAINQTYLGGINQQSDFSGLNGNGNGGQARAEQRTQSLEIEPLITELVVSDLIWDCIQLALIQVDGEQSKKIYYSDHRDENLRQSAANAAKKHSDETTAVDKVIGSEIADKSAASSIRKRRESDNTARISIGEISTTSPADIAVSLRRHSTPTINKHRPSIGRSETLQTPAAINTSPLESPTNNPTIAVPNRSFRSSQSDSSADNSSVSASYWDSTSQKSPELQLQAASSRRSPVTDVPISAVDDDSKKLRKDGSRSAGARKPAIGTKISEGHVNYVLMYDMLTGIRIAVSRCVAKPHRELTLSDFRARHKLTFDIMGNELTPSSRYDFKFKDYAPWVFRNIREHFKIEAADYLVSLTGKYVLSELGSSGKSGSFFYFSQDYRFIIKTIHHTEHKVLFRMLPKYYEHIKNNQNTLLTRYLGLHRVKLPRGKKIHFVVMGNVFPPNKDIHETFDLKGSLIGREVTEQEIRDNPRVVMKDINWLKLNRRLAFGSDKRKLLTEQLEKDVNFLMEMQLMDYSLLTGLHYLQIGNSENIRDKLLSVFEPNQERLAKQPVSSKKANLASEMRKVIAESETVELGTSSNKLPNRTPNERRGCIFYRDDGGFRSTNLNNFPLSELYFIGIIDILTPYNYVKKIEHTWKSLRSDKHLISAVQPKEYGRRFMEFLVSKVISGNQALEPPAIGSTPDPAPEMIPLSQVSTQ